MAIKHTKPLRNDRNAHQAMVDDIKQEEGCSHFATLSNWDHMDSASRAEMLKFRASLVRKSYKELMSEWDKKQRRITAIMDACLWVAGVALIAAMLTSNVWLPALIAGFN